MRLFFALWPDHALQMSLAETTRNVVAAAGGRPVPPENFHVTLAFLGSVPEARLSQVVAIAQNVANEIAGTPAQVTFDAIEYWKKPQVLCATGRPAASAGCASCEALAGSAFGEALAGPASAAALSGSPSGAALAVTAGATSAGTLAGTLKAHLTTGGFAPDLKSSWSVGGRRIGEFRPHVTLARKLAHPIHRMGIQPVLWTFTDFALVDSRTEPNGSVYTVLQTFPCARVPIHSW